MRHVLPMTHSWLPRTAVNKIPETWGLPIANQKGVGLRWFGPNPNSQGVRIDKAVPGGQPTQQVTHVVVRDGGRILGRDGKPITGSLQQNPTAHIPLDEWVTWSQWNKP
ncbi:hypothetical protein ACQPZF_10960 [Actinosynnema sp. CS-041913]|uniref:hypothetical protein n=1 Tax=Actinosynnema sp. CS-041913 TaxID=3239917 RepID=UPI003D8D9788